MQSVSNILKNKKSETIVTIESNNLNTIVNCSSIDNKEIDLVLSDYQNLRDTSFTAWHASCIRKLGVDVYCRLASTAKEGKNPPRYFTWLLQKELAH